MLASILKDLKNVNIMDDFKSYFNHIRAYLYEKLAFKLENNFYCKLISFTLHLLIALI
jgi:hypothetical protein